MRCHQSGARCLQETWRSACTSIAFSGKGGWGYSGKSSLSVNVSKEMKFVKAKEPMVATPSVVNVKVEKKPNGNAQKVLT